MFYIFKLWDRDFASLRFVDVKALEARGCADVSEYSSLVAAHCAASHNHLVTHWITTAADVVLALKDAWFGI
jgi:hypothetical protein